MSLSGKRGRKSRSPCSARFKISQARLGRGRRHAGAPSCSSAAVTLRAGLGHRVADAVAAGVTEIRPGFWQNVLARAGLLSSA